MSDEGRMRLPHILYFSTLRNWCRLLKGYGGQIDRSRRWLVIRITLFVIATIPIRLLERLLFGIRIARHRVAQAPVQIIGHWRSGTTNTHNLLLQDPQYCTVQMLHCAIPSGFLTWGWLARLILRRRLPASRPMDAVPLGVDEPMSEDFALAGLTHMSHYLNYFFPRIGELTFRRTVLFEDVLDSDRRHWERAYEFLLRKVSFAGGGRRLLLKNPPNLGRIAAVLRLYPDTRFIHVVRNPWLVHASTMKLMERFTAQLSLQDADEHELEAFVSRRYQMLMDHWRHERNLIPAGQLIEVRHEDIVRDPVSVVCRIYETLGLSNWDELRPRLEAYAASLKGYQTNEYRFSKDYLDRIRPYLSSAAAEYGYEEPAGIPKSLPAHSSTDSVSANEQGIEHVPAWDARGAADDQHRNSSGDTPESQVEMSGLKWIPARGAILCVRLYQLLISPWLGRNCRFHPSCSRYFIAAVEKRGLWKGGWQGVRRICRCHPWNPGGYDPP